MSDKRKQKQYKFTLSVRDKHNREVKKIVDFLAGKGVLSQAVRDALRLLNDLRRGNTKVLLELFPDIVEKLCPPTPKNDDDLKREIAELKLMFVQQRQLPQGDPIQPPPPGYPAMKQSGVGIGKLANRKLELPVLVDDDDDTLVMKKGTSAMTGGNLLSGILGLD